MATENGVPAVQGVDNNNEAAKPDVPFDDAMTLTGFGKFNIYGVLFCGFMLLGMILETLGFSYIIPACQCDLELNLVQKGWLAAIPFVAIVITSYMWGYLADTRGRKTVLIFCMSIGAFFSIISSFSPDLATFAVLRFIASIFIAGESALGYAYLGELNPVHQRDKMLTLGNASVALGTAVVPLIAWAVLPSDFQYHIAFLGIQYRPWRLLVSLFAVPNVLCAIIICKCPESPKFLMSSGNPDKALEVLRYIFTVNTGKSPEEYPVSKIKNDENVNRSDELKPSILSSLWNQTAPLFRGRYLMYTAIICFLQFANFATTNGLYLWYPTIINKMLDTHLGVPSSGLTNMCAALQDGLNKTKNIIHNQTVVSTVACDDTLVTGAFTLTIILSTVVTIVTISIAFTLKFFGKRNLLMGLYVFSCICSFCIHWLTNHYVSIVIFSFLQLCGACIGLTNAYAVEIFPTNYRAMAVCLTMMMGRVGSVAGTNVIGALIETVCPVTFFAFALLLFASFLVCFALPVNKVPPKEIVPTAPVYRPYTIT